MAFEPTLYGIYLTVNKLNNNEYPGCDAICAEGVVKTFEFLIILFVTVGEVRKRLMT